MLIEVVAFKPSVKEKEYKIESLVTDLTGQLHLDKCMVRADLY
jgi:hypothetical protein